MAALGLIVQFYMSKGKPVLPHEAPRKKRNRERTRGRISAAEVPRSSAVNNYDDPLPVLVTSRRGNRTIHFDESDEEPDSRASKTNGDGQYSTKYGTNVVC